MKISDAELQAYVDGELAPADAARVDAAVAADVMVAARVDRERRLRGQIREVYDRVPDQTGPGRFAANPGRRTEVEQPRFDGRPEFSGARSQSAVSRWRIPGVALAATVATLAIAMGLRAPAQMVGTTGGQLVARGTLARALDDAFAGDPGGDVDIGMTFRGRDGRVCRSFVTRSANLAGLACRLGDGWSLPVVAQDAGHSDGTAPPMPPEVQAGIEARMAGPAFDAQRERASRAAHWQ